jgi:hypothetical protein
MALVFDNKDPNGVVDNEDGNIDDPVVHVGVLAVHVDGRAWNVRCHKDTNGVMIGVGVDDAGIIVGILLGLLLLLMVLALLLLLLLMLLLLLLLLLLVFP